MIKMQPCHAAILMLPIHFTDLEPVGLCQTIDAAMQFQMLPVTEKEQQISRNMDQSLCAFNHQVTTSQYIALYEKMLKQPLVFQEPMRAVS